MAARSSASLQQQLQSSQEARHRQAVLVQQLQAKVRQYRTRCRELEQKLQAGAGTLPGRWKATENNSLEKALLQLKKKQQRCDNLAEESAVLWQHLNKANEVNSALREDVGKLTVDWMGAQKELKLKESEWRHERELYDSYLSGERNRLLSLWCQVVTFRRHFLELKTATDRDLAELKAEQMRLSGSILASCSCLNSGMHLWESIALRRPVMEDQAQQEAGQEISQKTCEVMRLQVKEDLEKEELQDRLKVLAALEGKYSLLQSELVVTREALDESYVQGDLLKQEKHELTVALEKLQQKNEGLSFRVDKMEKAKMSDEEKLSSCERTIEELCTEKARLEQLLKKAEEQQQELQVELRMLAEAKAETQEKLSQAYHQQELASSSLEQLRQESSHQGHALAMVYKEKEFLVCEKASLEVQLEATEQDRQGLSEQLAEARLVKENLESSLLQAQQRLSQLEIIRIHLEIQLHTVTRAKEVIQGEVTCLQRELEEERSLMKQEQESMAQQLLRTKQQYDNALSLQQTDHEMKINKLLQDMASEKERHHSELQEMLEKWEKDKEDSKREHEKQLFDLKQKVSTLQAQEEEERTRDENAKQEVQNLLEMLFQTQGELREALQQLEQLRQEVGEQRENEQNFTEKLQAAQSESKAVEERHKEEIKIIKEEMYIALQQRDALQKQVEELVSRLAASEESQQLIGRKAQQDLSRAQELSRQKVLEVVHLQKILEEKRSQWEEIEHQNKELQVCLQTLEGKRSLWEEVERQNTEFQASLKVLESEKARLTLSLEEKELSLRTLKENNLAQHNEVSQLLSAIHQAQQLHSDHRREIKELNNQIQSLEKVVLEKEAGLATREKQLLQDLQESQAGEQRLRDSLCMLEAEMSELHLKLCSTENKAKALATECQQANSARCKAQSQLDELRLVVHRMICDSRDLVSWSSEQGHVWGLTVSQARDLPAELTVDRVVAALQDLHQHLKQTRQALNNVKKIEDLELELSKRQAEIDHFSAHNQELQKQLAQSQEETQMAERKKNSLQAALQEEAAALKEETLTLHQEVVSLERKLKTTEKERKDVLDELNRLQAVKEKLVGEIKLLEVSVAASEMRANTATDMNHSLEQELQTTLSIFKIKNEELEMQWEKIQMLEKEAAEVKVLQETLAHMTAVLSENEGEMKLYQEQIRMLEKQKEIQKTALDEFIKDVTEENQKEKRLMIESQKKLTETFQKQQEDSKQQKEILQHCEMALKEKEQEILSLRKQCEAYKEKEEKHEAEQTNLEATKVTLKEREEKIGVLEEAISKLQQQKEEAAMQTKAILQKLEYAESSLAARDQEKMSLQEHVQDLREQKEIEGKHSKRLQQDLDKMKEILKENCLEFLKQKEEMNILRVRGESLKVALTSCQKQVSLLEEAVRQRDKDKKTLTEKLQHQEEVLKTLQNLQLRLTEKNEEVRHQREQEKFHRQATEGGKQLSWLSEKRTMLQQLENLQREVARLKLEKTELKQLNADIRRTLQQVEHERRQLKRWCSSRSSPDACEFSVSAQHKMPTSRQTALEGEGWTKATASLVCSLTTPPLLPN